MKKVLHILIVGMFTIGMTGCAPSMVQTTKAGTQQVEQRVGFVMTAKNVKVEAPNSIFKSIVGTAVGALIGTQIGQGAGKTVATVAGGIVGGVAGSSLSTVDGQKITVLLETKKTVMITKPIENGVEYHAGDYVMVTFTLDGQANEIEMAKEETIKKLIASRALIVQQREKVVREIVYIEKKSEQKTHKKEQTSSNKETKRDNDKSVSTRSSAPVTQISQKTNDGVDFMVVEK